LAMPANTSPGSEEHSSRTPSASPRLRWRESALPARAMRASLLSPERSLVRGARLATNRLTLAVLHALEHGARVPFAEAHTEENPVELVKTLLQAAAEVEHALLAEYLYGYFSLDPNSTFTGDQGFTLREIAIEEMGHLMCVQNLLLSVGAGPHFNLQAEAPNPGEQAIYPFPLHMRPLTKAALATYVTAEAPVPLPGLSEEDRAAAVEADTLSKQELAGGVIHVGMLYARLLWLFRDDDQGGGPQDFTEDMTVHFGDARLPSDFVFQTEGQETQDGWGTEPAGFFVETVASRADARRVMQRIAVQGEGWDTLPDTAPSHFERFLAIFRAYPAENVLRTNAENPVLPNDPPWPGNAVSTPLAGDAEILGRFFRLRYRILLGTLGLLLFPTVGTALRDLARAHALFGMRRALHTFAGALAGQHLGAPFRLLQPPPSTVADVQAELVSLFAETRTAVPQLPAGQQGFGTQLIGKDAALQALFQ
ncbi:MAG TPA: ferritin-like domain-containing protein, partial [Chthoniobacteraceae bacterium]|nr:ferritin-like domain-containing protein [Chthoniobacteraceae bacterium]